jgi:isoaspartyl peptidase/L-asparaginase-like protein (Ntn-hydrolase superfamily)
MTTPTSSAIEKILNHIPLRVLGERYGQQGEVDWRELWNFPNEIPAPMKAWGRHGDTVGAVVRTEDGRFASALSTGGRR